MLLLLPFTGAAALVPGFAACVFSAPSMASTPVVIFSTPKLKPVCGIGGLCFTGGLKFTTCGDGESGATGGMWFGVPIWKLPPKLFWKDPLM